jgi:hypothetical protein
MCDARGFQSPRHSLQKQITSHPFRAEVLKIFYLQIEFTFPPKNLRLSNTEYSSDAYIESVVSKTNICSDGRSKLLTLNLKVELCAKIN